MIESRTLSRREAIILLGGATITIAACGSSSPSNPSGTPTPGATPTPGGTVANKTAQISANHGHTLTITAAQLTAAGALTLTTTGNAGHDHTLALTGAEVTQIAGGTQVAKATSTDGGHSHTATFN